MRFSSVFLFLQLAATAAFLHELHPAEKKYLKKRAGKALFAEMNITRVEHVPRHIPTK